MEPAGRMHHVFVDFENVQTIELASLGKKNAQVILLLGGKQKQLPVALVQQLLKHPARIRIIEMDRSGKNALDFVLAYYVGQAVAGDPGGSFHVVSGDKDFDPLIAHLRSNHILAYRQENLSLTPISTEEKRGLPEDPEGRITFVIDWLKKIASSRPKRKVTLLAHINNFCSKKLTEAEQANIADELVRRGVIDIDPKGIVSYRFPTT